jgi:kynureninase
VSEISFEATRDFVQALDAADPLADFRAEFNIPPVKNGLTCVYLTGNSLGAQPKLAAQYVREELEDWANLGVEGHVHARRPWLSYHRLAAKGFAALTGSEEQEVVAMNTLTVNLHLMMATFYRPAGKRRKILIESTAFPSDRFAVMSQLRLHGHQPGDALIEWTPRIIDGALRLDDLQAILDDQGDEIALMLLPGVQYYSGQVLPMAELCGMARNTGCRIGFDLAHAVGNVPLELHEWGPDFAAWCTYKYLNSGPGAIGGAFVHARHLDADGSEQLLGWWSHEEETRFRMANSFTPAKGADLWQLSNPPILSLAPVIASLQVFAAAGMDKLREKSLRLTGFTDFLLQERLAGRVESMTPSDARGCQLSLVVRDQNCVPKAVFDALIAQNVIADWREPNVIRVAPVPLYNRYEDAFDFVERLQKAMDG